MTTPLDDFLAEGWQIGGDSFSNADRCCWAPLHERGGLPNCECNGRPPLLMLYEWSHRGQLSYEVNLRGERNGIWLDIKAYSPRNREEIDRGIEAVKKAWKA